MRVTSISMLSNDKEAISFDLRNVASQSPYMVKTIIGLDADELIPRFYGFSKNGTKKFYDFKLKPRDIVMRIVMNPRFNLDESTSYIRDTLYRAISATRTGQLQLQFQAGASTVARIYGHMTKFEVPYFSKTPELQITIRCDDPMFRGLNPVIYETADLSTGTVVEVADSLSTAPHGFTMNVNIQSTLSEFVISDKATDPDWEFKVIPATSFLSGDILYMSSEFNARELYRIRGGVTTYLLDAIDPSSYWPLIFPIFNEFYFAQAAAFSWDFLRFDAAYWGI